MDEPKVAQNSPYPVVLEPGKKYYWCMCGESKNSTILRWVA